MATPPAAAAAAAQAAAAQAPRGAAAAALGAVVAFAARHQTAIRRTFWLSILAKFLYDRRYAGDRLSCVGRESVSEREREGCERGRGGGKEGERREQRRGLGREREWVSSKSNEEDQEAKKEKRMSSERRRLSCHPSHFSRARAPPLTLFSRPCPSPSLPRPLFALPPYRASSLSRFLYRARTPEPFFLLGVPLG